MLEGEVASGSPVLGPGFRPPLGDPHRQGTQLPWCAGRGGRKQVRDEPPQLKSGVYWDNPQYGVVGGGGWLEGQMGWREAMKLLQYAALRKCTGAVLGSRKTLLQRVVAVESAETFARVATGRFLAWKLCDPVRAGVAAADDPVLEGKGELSLGGACWRGVVDVVDLGPSGDVLVEEWEQAIGQVRGGASLLFTGGSYDDSGRVGGGWWGSCGARGSMAVGTVATVWDGEVAGMRLALESILVSQVLVL